MLSQGSSAQIVGINESGFELANETFTTDRDLPWLQDTEQTQLWDVWAVSYRDLYLVDGDGVLRDIYNLSSNDLRGEAATAELLSLIGELEGMTFDPNAEDSSETDTGEGSDEDTGQGSEERTEERTD